MVTVCGPNIPPESIKQQPGVTIHGYLPRLYEHFAACDLAVAQAGGMSTIELTALNKPFIYFPVEGHFEQEKHVSGRLERHGVGVRMNLSQTTAQQLAETLLKNLGVKPETTRIGVNGAMKAASLIVEHLEDSAPR